MPTQIVVLWWVSGLLIEGIGDTLWCIAKIWRNAFPPWFLVRWSLPMRWFSGLGAVAVVLAAGAWMMLLADPPEKEPAETTAEETAEPNAAAKEPNFSVPVENTSGRAKQKEFTPPPSAPMFSSPPSVQGWPYFSPPSSPRAMPSQNPAPPMVQGSVSVGESQNGGNANEQSYDINSVGEAVSSVDPGDPSPAKEPWRPIIQHFWDAARELEEQAAIAEQEEKFDEADRYRQLAHETWMIARQHIRVLTNKEKPPIGNQPSSVRAVFLGSADGRQSSPPKDASQPSARFSLPAPTDRFYSPPPTR